MTLKELGAYVPTNATDDEKHAHFQRIMEAEQTMVDRYGNPDPLDPNFPVIPQHCRIRYAWNTRFSLKPEVRRKFKEGQLTWDVLRDGTVLMYVPGGQHAIHFKRDDQGMLRAYLWDRFDSNYYYFAQRYGIYCPTTAQNAYFAEKWQKEQPSDAKPADTGSGTTGSTEDADRPDPTG